MHPAPIKGAKKAPPLFPPLHTVHAAFTAHGVPPIQNAVQASHEILASRRLSRSNCAKGRYQHIGTTPFPFNFIYEPIIAQTQTNYKGRASPWLKLRNHGGIVIWPWLRTQKQPAGETPGGPMLYALRLRRIKYPRAPKPRAMPPKHQKAHTPGPPVSGIQEAISFLFTIATVTSSVKTTPDSFPG